jgi:methylated-DNA-[protein]-cysteine S-methyltransferase
MPELLETPAAVTTLAWDAVAVPGPVRALTFALSGSGLVAVSFGAGTGGIRAAAGKLGARLVRDPVRTAPVAGQLAAYLAGELTAFDVPLDWRLSTGVQQTVLRTLFETVPFGQTVTYGQLALRSGAFDEALGEPGVTGARSVGGIMGSNPIPVVVPCHRVLASNGLGGFGGGLEAKRWLLELEGVLPPSLELDFG